MPLPAKLIPLLGILTDEEIGRRAGCTAAWVCIQRNQMGIPAKRGRDLDLVGPEETLRRIRARARSGASMRSSGLPVKLLRHVVMHDCGKVINPLVVEGQIVGGVAHGIGNALFERLRFDDGAQPLTTNLGEYLLPLATDMPPVEAHHMETPTPLNPLGVKGSGEGGTIGSIAAIISAVENALEPFGVHISEAPIEPQRIVELLGDAARGRTR